MNIKYNYLNNQYSQILVDNADYFIKHYYTTGISEYDIGKRFAEIMLDCIDHKKLNDDFMQGFCDRLADGFKTIGHGGC